jgi:ribosomal protein L28
MNFVLLPGRRRLDIRDNNMRKCAICGKTYTKSITRKKLRGKYNPTSKKKKYPNLQWVRIPIDIRTSPTARISTSSKLKKSTYKKWAGKRILACTKCIKALSKLK